MRFGAYLKYYGRCSYDYDPKLYLDWYRHYKGFKHKGLSVRVGFLGYTLELTLVNDRKLYALDMKKKSRNRG